MAVGIATAMIVGAAVGAGSQIIGGVQQSRAVGRAGEIEGDSTRQALAYAKEQDRLDRAEREADRAEREAAVVEKRRQFELRETQLKPYRERGQRGLATMGQLLAPEGVAFGPTAARPWADRQPQGPRMDQVLSPLAR